MGTEHREAALRRAAARQGLAAHKLRTDGTWFFADPYTDSIVGPEPLQASPCWGGMALEEAEEFLVAAEE